jgi:hypothetical protein
MGDYTMPLEDGNNGQVLQTDGSGNISWSDQTVNTDQQQADVFQLNGNDLELSLQNDGIATQTVDLSGYLDNTDSQDLSLSSHTLSLTNDASAVDLSPYLDNTDAQQIDVFGLSGNNLELSLQNDGIATQTVDLSGYLDNTDSQGLSLSSHTLSLTNDATAVDLSPYLDNTDAQRADVFGLSGNNLQLSLENDGVATQTVDLSGYLDNTDGQDLSLSAHTLSLTNDATTVDLSPYLDNTDAQRADVFGLSGNNLQLSLQNDGIATQTVDLSGYLDNTDSQDLSLSSHTLSLTNDATTVDLSPYLDNTDAQRADVFRLNGNNLELSLQNDGVATQAVNLSGYLDNTDNQDLSLSSHTLSLTNDATTVDLSPYMDNTDAQSLSIANSSLSISGGNSIDLNTAEIKLLQDNDNDTKIQVEESADEDKIRLDLAGVESFVFTQGRIEVANTNESIFIGQAAGQNANMDSVYANTFVGDSAGYSNVSARANTGFGWGTLKDNTEIGNTAIGSAALNENTTGQRNTALGWGAMQKNTSGNNNVAVEASGLWSNTTGSHNATLGNYTLSHIQTGSYNIALGHAAMNGATAGSWNVGIGYLTLHKNQGSDNVAIAAQALTANTTGSSNLAMGFGTLSANTTGSFNVAVGQQSGSVNVSGSNNTYLGYRSGSLATGSGNVFLGYQSGYNETGNNKLYIENSSSTSPLTGQSRLKNLVLKNTVFNQPAGLSQ